MNLIEPARRSLNYLTTSVDPGRDGMPYFMTFWHPKGLEYRHNPWDIVENPGRFSEGVALIRRMTGQDAETETEGQWKDLLERLWDDRFGLYIVPRGLSFVQTDLDAARCCGARHTREDDASCNWDNRSAYMGMVLRGLLFGDEQCVEMGRRILTGYDRWAVRDERRQWAWYTTSYITAGNLPDGSGPPVPGQEMGGIISLLVKDFQWFDREQSLELAQGLANCMMHFARIGEPWPPNYNTHSYFHYLAGLVRLYRATSERRYLEYARAHFEHYQRRFASSFGWVSEFPDADLMDNTPASRSRGTIPAAEGCSTVDLIDAAILLARSGHPEYWSVAERAGRNYLVCGQVTDAGAFPDGHAGEDDGDSSFTDIPNRLVGNLAGWGDPHDIVNFDNRTGRRVFQSCCGARLPYGLFQLWDNAVTREAGVVSINLSFDRETPHVRCVHTTNGDGRFAINVKQDCRVRLRVPEGVAATDVRVDVDGRSRDAPAFDGHYLDLGPLPAGTELVARHPRPTRRATEHVPVYDRDFDIEWHGNDVMSIRPEGEHLPVFGPRAKALRTAAADTGACVEAFDI